MRYAVPAPLIDKQLKDYRITARVGRGGMGEVYAAAHVLLGTNVAIKVLREDISREQAHVQRFFNEALAASKIKHAGIVHIFDAGFADGRAYLVMELLEGESLAARLGRTPRLSVDDIVDTFAQMASVLEATHRVGITHRDLKPDNVFLVEDRERASGRRVKLLDFGIAKLGDSANPAGSTALTASNSSMGTPGYMAPEQWRDAANATSAADVYSLGCVAFELCCGRPPFVATSMAEACERHLHAEPPRVRSLTPEAPVAIDALVARMLAKRPEDRPSMTEVGATLAEQRAKPGSPRSAPLATAEAVMDTARAAPTPVTPIARGVEAAPTAPGGVATAPSAARTSPGGVVTAPSAASIAPGGVATVPSAAPTAPADPPAQARRGRALVVLAIAVAAIAVTIAFQLGRRGETPAPPAAGSGSASVAVASPTRDAEGFTPVATNVRCPDGMVGVPGGSFWMGDEGGENEHAKPRHEVTLRAFCIDRTEVTVGAYAACVKTGRCTPAPVTVAIDGWSADKRTLWSKFCNGDRADRRDHPINCVEWEHAHAFCAAAHARLPTEAEWELAARGTDGRRYPWGNEPPDAKRLNACDRKCKDMAAQLGQTWGVMFEGDDGWATTAPVGSYPDGASPYGVHDMAGNVSEWVADWFGPYPSQAAIDPTGPSSGEERVVRFTDWQSLHPRDASTWWRSSLPPANRSSYIGFRCAASPL